MILRELLLSSVLGIGLATTSSSFFANSWWFPSKSTEHVTQKAESSSEPLNVPGVQAEEDPGYEEDESFAKDYESKEKVTGWRRVKVTRKDGKGTYIAQATTSLDMKFELPSSITDEKLSSVKIDQISIYLFKEPVWSREGLTEDVYVSTSKQQVSSLFAGKDENSIKRLLLLLSTRKFWSKSMDNSDPYYLPIGVLVPNSEKDLTFSIKIKYFKKFGALKKFIHEKLNSCSSSSCSISESDLSNMLDQDKQSFFDIAK